MPIETYFEKEIRNHNEELENQLLYHGLNKCWGEKLIDSEDLNSRYQNRAESLAYLLKKTIENLDK
jgi:hypothetical protein